MRELSLHILDLAENSTRAGASLGEIDIVESQRYDSLLIRIKDDGKGFEVDAKTGDPYFTSKGGKRFGLGIPLFRQAAEAAEGSLKIDSSPGGGTTMEARFRLGHIDLMPMGDLGATLSALVCGSPAADFVLRHRDDEDEFVFDTRQLRAKLDGLPLSVPQVLKYIIENVNESIRRSNGR